MNTYEHQRWICRQAREHGWKGQEPSVLGTHAANLVIDEVRAFIRALPESCRDLIWDQYGRDNVPAGSAAASIEVC